MVSVSRSRRPMWSQTWRKSTRPRSLSLARSESGLRSIVTTGCILGGSFSGTHSSALINRFLLFSAAHHCPHHRRRLEDHAYVSAPTFGTHEPAAEPAQGEVPSLGPYECRHVQDRLMTARLDPNRAFNVAPDTAHA